MHTNHARTFCALVRRDLYVLRGAFVKSFLDGILILLTQVVITRYFFPYLGMPQELIAPLYIGTVVMMLIHQNFSLSIENLLDLQSERIIEYRLILPITPPWLMASYITRWILRMMVTTSPLIILGALLLGPAFPLTNIQPGLFVVIYLLSALLFATYFLASSFAYSYDWFINNFWPRRLDPILTFSAFLFPWYRITDVCWWAGVISLANPVTYVAEGCRATLIANTNYLNPLLCIAILSGACIVGAYWLLSSMYKRLDPV